LTDEQKSKPSRKRWSRWRRVGVGLGLLILLAWWPPVYIGLPISGQVVDAKTGEPLAGVAVLSYTNLYARFGIIHPGDVMGAYRAAESVTDEDGRFYFWPWIGIRPIWGRLRWDRTPTVEFFKAGYLPEHRLNARVQRVDRRLNPFRWSVMFDEPVRLERNNLAPEKYAGLIDGTYSSHVERLHNAGNLCDRMPATLRALHDEFGVLHNAGVRVFGVGIYLRAEECLSAKQ
jgi:hypothetical protein